MSAYENPDRNPNQTSPTKGNVPPGPVNYKYNIVFNTDKTNVVVEYVPKVDEDKGFNAGDTVTFDSTEAPWKVGYNNSPFNENGGVQVFEGGQSEKGKDASVMVRVLRTGRYGSDCGLWNGKVYVGYGTGGGDPIKTAGNNGN
jgi:hypothetical protein